MYHDMTDKIHQYQLAIDQHNITALRAYLHQASASTQSQHCDDDSNTALVETNGVTSE